MPAAGIIFLLVVFGLSGSFTLQAFRHAQANGRTVPSRADWKPRLPALFTSRQAAPAVTGGSAATTGKAKSAATRTKRKPQTVRAIIAQGVTDNWVAHRAHVRANPQRSRRRRAFDRLVFPGGRRDSPPKPPESATTTKEAPEPMTETPAATVSAPSAEPAEPPSPISSSNGHSGGGGGGGAAADFFHSITAVTGPAKAGGIKSKQRAVKTLAAGMPSMASALEEFARWCQEPAQGYGAPLFERLMKMANCLRAAGMEGAEADTYMTELANKPLGEVATSRVQAPSSREINTE